jgi:hypothetical protein
MWPVYYLLLNHEYGTVLSIKELTTQKQTHEELSVPKGELC